MGYTKDLWSRPDPGDKSKRIPSARHGKGKRWLACWLDPEGRERTRAFGNKRAADTHWQKQATDVERGDYRDPKSGKEELDTIAQRWLQSRDVDPATLNRYSSIYRLHIKPEFGGRRVAGVKPSEVQEHLHGLSQTYSRTTRDLTKFVLGSILDLADADGLLKHGNPARSKVVTATKPVVGEITHVWSDKQVSQIIAAHPDWLRVLPQIGATCGLREGELFGLAVGDVEGDVLHVRRQVKKVDGVWIFGLPKNDTAREVPLSGWTEQCITAHKANHKPTAVTLPWEKAGGSLVTHQLLIPHPKGHLTAARCNPHWQAALHKAGIIGPPVRKSHVLAYPTTRDVGRHALRHYYASLQLAEGTTITELAAYLGHHDPAFTLRKYGKLQPNSHERARKAIDARFFRPRAV